MNEIERVSEVMVDLVTSPSYGVLQYRENETSLPPSFSYTLFLQGKISYSINNHKVQTTSDSFDVQLRLGHGISEIVTIVICINPLPYPELVQLGNLSSYVTGLVAFSSDVLKATQLHLLDSKPKDLVYDVVATPTYGVILREGMLSSVSSLYDFTQEEVNKGKIFYVNKRKSTNGKMTDEFQFRLRNQYYEIDTVYTLIIQLKENKIEVVNKGITVKEGGIHVISSNELSSTVPDGYTLQSLYLIIRPSTGSIILKRPSPEPTIEDPGHFELSDIQNGYLFYNHSGKEDIMDMFNVLFVAKKTGYDTLDLPVWINVTILPINDLAPSKLANHGMSVTEGSSTPITLDRLEYEDEDYGYDNDNLIYIMTFRLISGEICLNGSCTVGYPGYKWYQRDMRMGNLVYKHKVGDDSIAIILFEVYDFINEHRTGDLFIIKILELVPTRIGNAPLFLLEGGSVPISASNINFTSDGVSPNEYRYNVTKLPTKGTLSSTDVSLVVGTFTQEDINNRSIIYHHDGSNSFNDSFEFMLTVRSHQQTYEVQVLIAPVDDDVPQLIENDSIFVDFTKSVHLNNTQLLIGDTDTNPRQLQYEIKHNVKYGVLEKRSNVNGDTYTKTNVFTQNDINEENVRYRHTHPHTEQGLLVDYFTFDISDGFNSAGPFNASIFILPERVAIKVLGSSVHEDQSVVLPYDSIIIYHPYFAGKNGEVSIPNGVKHGYLRINGLKCTSVCDFHTDELAEGKIEYVHEGGEDEFDSFNFFINWQGLLRTDNMNYTIAILPVNDQPPSIAISKDLLVWATDIVTLTPSLLLTTDPDTAPNKLVYHFNLTPEQEADGHFSLVGNPRQKNYTFTQADINNGLITYVDKHTYDGIARRLQFNVTDGNYTVKGEIVVTAQVVSLQELGNVRLVVQMGYALNITNKQLSYVTNNPDINSSMIIYHITEGFKYGGIFHSNGQERINFTQAEINSNQIMFVHTGIDVWEAMDSAIVMVSAPLASKESITIAVDINLLNGSNPLARNQPLSVMEGNTVCFDQEHLDGRNVRYNSWKAAAYSDNVSLADTLLTYEVTRLPTHGSLVLNHTQITKFHHSDLLTGLLCYENDGSESTIDSILFDVVVSTPHEEISRISDTLYINVDLVNDEEPVLVSTNTHLTITSGFWFPITSNDLKVTDADNLPEEITFTVSNKPRELLILVNDNVVNGFTQADIDNGSVTILSNKTGNTSFSVTCNDGLHNLDAILFQVTVHEHVLQLLVNETITLRMLQTQQEVLINTDIADTTTNGWRHETQYIVTKRPENGQILVNGKEAGMFLQTDVDNGRVSYKVTGTQSTRDNVEVMVTNIKASKTLSINIIISASGEFNEAVETFLPSVGTMVQLPSGIMALEGLDEYRDINIKVTSVLRYGALYLKYPNTQTASRQVKSFEYSDLTNGYIHYKWWPSSNLIANHNYTEEITGMVEVNGLAPGEFSIYLTLQAPAEAVVTITEATASVSSPQPTQTGTPGTLGGGNESDGSQFDLAIYVPLIGFIVVIVIGFVVVVGFCCSQSRHIKRKLYHKASTGVNFNRASPTGKSSSIRQSPTRLPHSPQLTGGFDQEYSDSESSSPDVMMTQQTHGQQQMTTISASHTYLPTHSQSSFDPVSSGYHTQLSTTMGGSPTTFLRHQESPIVSASGNYPSNPNYAFSRNELRSSSPVRKINGSRRNTRQYASMTISTGKGKTSPTRSRDYNSPLHALGMRSQVRDSTSSLGYDTSSMTQESSTRVPSVTNPSAPINLDAIINQEGISDLYRRTHPLLKPSQHWV